MKRNNILHFLEVGIVGTRSVQFPLDLILKTDNYYNCLELYRTSLSSATFAGRRPDCVNVGPVGSVMMRSIGGR